MRPTSLATLKRSQFQNFGSGMTLFGNLLDTWEAQRDHPRLRVMVERRSGITLLRFAFGMKNRQMVQYIFARTSMST